jgi:sugar/nucleoside kinase (ribokinase family)
MTFWTAPRARAAVASLGEVMSEVIIHAESLPTPNSTLVWQQRAAPLGGAALNVAWYLFELGWPARLVAGAGADDIAGIHDVLHPHTVSEADLVLAPGPSDQLLTVLTRNAHVSLYRLANYGGAATDALYDGAGTAEVIVLSGGRHPEVRAAYVRIVQDRQPSVKLIVFNPSYAVTEYNSAELREIVSGCDVCVVNRDEHEAISSVVDIEAHLPSRLYVMTEASEGATIMYPGPGRRYAPPVQREGVFLGAGDAFVSGLTFALHHGQSGEQAVAFAQRVAAPVVLSGRIRTALPPVKELHEAVAGGQTGTVATDP